MLISLGMGFIDKATLYLDKSKPSSSFPGFAYRYCCIVVAKTWSEGAEATASQERKLKLKVQFVGLIDFFFYFKKIKESSSVKLPHPHQTNKNKQTNK